MKKILLCIALIACATSTYAQFEKEKWYVNASLTGFDVSHSKYEGTKLGLSVAGGAFIDDNLALIVGIKGDYVENGIDETSAGAQVRYYFTSCGIYGGMGLAYKHLSSGSVNKDITCFTPEIGYAFFLNRILTIEPAIYYDYSLSKPSQYSKLGMKIGFGLYF